MLSHVRLFETPWTVARQAPLSMGFSRQEYWSGLPFHSPGDLPDSRIEPRRLALQADSLLFELPRKPYIPLSKRKLRTGLSLLLKLGNTDHFLKIKERRNFKNHKVNFAYLESAHISVPFCSHHSTGHLWSSVDLSWGQKQHLTCLRGHSP